MSAAPSRSAIVRAMRRMRSWARADNPSSSIAALRIAIASGFKGQNFRTWRGVIRPLTCGPRGPKRLTCRARASSTWAQFLRSQAEALLACDFFETITLTGTRMYVLAVIEHAHRRIRILDATPHPTAA